MPKRGKRYRTALESYNKEQHYPPPEAVALVKQMATAKFDETIELHIRTGLDVRHADQQLRGTARLPHGLGKEVRVAVFAEGDAATAATEAGAEVVGSDDLIERVAGRIHGLRRGRCAARADGQGRQAGTGPGSARPDAESSRRHGGQP